MINSGSRSNSTDSDYELMQQQLPPPPPTPENRLQRGYSIREPRQPPLYQVPRPPQPSRVSPNRWRHLHRLSPGRNRNYAGLQDLRRGQRSEYAVPRVNRETEARRYDAFFRMSIAEEEEEEEGGREEREEHDEEAEKSIGNMTIVSEMSEPCSRHCKCLLLVFFLLLLLLTSLGGLGLALYNKFTRESSGGTQQAIMGTTCTETWCEHTVTMAVHAANCSMYNTSSECVTEPLSTNISVSPCDMCIAKKHLWVKPVIG